MNVRIWKAAAGALFGLCIAALSFAGARSGQPVVISDASNFAQGDLGYAHNTADTVSYIGCTVMTDTVGANVFCEARNRAGLTRSCSSTNPNMIAIASALNGDSGLSFSWNAAGQCTGISVDNDSRHEPKR